MKLHTMFRSSASYRVRIALAYKGLEHESAFLNLAKGEHHTDRYRAVNPQELVPALEVSGRTLIQSLAIIEYLDETHPQPPLLPPDPLDRAYVRACAQIVVSEMHPLNNLRVLNHLRSALGQDEAGVNRWYAHWINEGFKGLERYLNAEKRSGRYTFGDMVTMADCCLVPQVFNAQRYKCDTSPFKTVMRIFDECMKLDAFVSTEPSKQPDAF